MNPGRLLPKQGRSAFRRADAHYLCTKVDMPDYPPGCSGHPGISMHQHMGQQLAEVLRREMHW